MPLSTVLITLVAAGLLLWLVNRFIPMQRQIKSILNGLVVIVLILWIANLYGVFQHLHQFRVGRWYRTKLEELKASLPTQWPAVGN